MKLIDNHLVQPFVFKHHWYGIQNITVVVFNNAFLAYIAEKRDFVFNILCKRVLGAAYDNIGLYANGKQLFYTALCGLGFQLIGGCKIGHKRNMNKKAVFSAVLNRKLAYCFQKRLAFNIADCAADFPDGKVGLLRGCERLSGGAGDQEAGH